MTRSALVLGGGGITGIGWELGILHGLATAGLDLTGADLVVGTSAGSVVGAQVTSGRPLQELYDVQLRPATGEIAANLSRLTLLRLVPPLLIPGGSREKRARIGRMALKAHPPGDERRVEVIRGRIGDIGWPDRDLKVTAVRADTGELAVFDATSGVDLVHAVAASCAVPLVWPPVTVGGHDYVDGGVRSAANVDLASGYDVVVVLAPIARALSRATSIASQLERTGASRTAVVSPDAEAVAAIGRNALDPSKRADAARAGLRQAAAVLDEVRAAWV